jgi:HD-like signal output (HDOD) protein
MAVVGPTLTSSAVAGASASALRHRALGAIPKLPPFSPVLNKLLATLAGEDVSFAALGELIEKDTVVAGNLLRVVNSALYARRATVNSVRHALAVLGLAKVRNIVLGMSVSRMLNQVRVPRSFSIERFNRHSAAVALLSDHLAQHVAVQYPEGAFVAGLLHDVGRLLVAMALPDHYDAILRAYVQGGRTWVDCEIAVLGFGHAEMSGDVLAAWKLPGEIQTAAREHHLPAAESEGDLRLGRLVDAANQYVNSTGESILAQQRGDWADPAWIVSLGLSQDRLEQVLADFEAEHRAMSQFYC